MRYERSDPHCRGDAKRGSGSSPPRSCQRPDLTAWASQGGALPARLSVHIQNCPSCAERVRRVNQTHAGLMLLSHQALPPHLHARANGRAMRMLRRAERASAAARRLLAIRPDLPLFERARVHMTRAACGAAAALLVLVLRTGTQQGINRTVTLGQKLASLHYERHIDPDGEWLV